MKTVMNAVFEVIADGKRNGISIAGTQQDALANAVKARTRQTASKMETTCDYTSVGVRPLGSNGPWLLSVDGRIDTEDTPQRIIEMHVNTIPVDEVSTV